MDIADAVLGKLVLTTALVLYVIFIFWVNLYPFIDDDLWLYQYILDPKWVLLSCALWGLSFVGGLMLFTLYHVYPHL